jgi:hypothetical protein
MDSILWGLTYEACLMYLCDVIIAGHMFQVWLDILRKVFQWFRGVRMKLNWEKCQL